MTVWSTFIIFFLANRVVEQARFIQFFFSTFLPCPIGSHGHMSFVGPDSWWRNSNLSCNFVRCRFALCEQLDDLLFNFRTRPVGANTSRIITLVTISGGRTICVIFFVFVFVRVIENQLQKHLSIAVELCLTDSSNCPHRRQRTGQEFRHFSQAAIMKDNVGRYTLILC